MATPLPSPDTTLEENTSNGEQAASVIPALALPQEKRTVRQRTYHEDQRLWGWLFLSPWIIGFLVFTVFPMLASLVFSFTDFKVGQPVHFVGLHNWRLLFSDPTTLNSLAVTLRFGAIALPISILVPLGLATLLCSKALRAKPLFRVLFYMPYMIPTISAIFACGSILNQQTGWLNRIIHLLDPSISPNWVQPPYLTTGLILLGMWGMGNTVLTMIVAMQGVSTELYEAASVDGLAAMTTWYKITLPMISPVIFYNIVLSSIGLMQYFIIPYILTNIAKGDPNLNFINLHLYRTAFQFQQMGYASAMAWFMFVIGLIITIALFTTARRWVFYASDN